MPLHAEATDRQTALPGAPVIARIRRVLVLALLLALAYTVFSSGSKASCPGGFGGEGRYTHQGNGSSGNKWLDRHGNFFP